MSVIGKTEILGLVKKGVIKIEPFEEKNIGPASIDLRLGNEFRIFKKGGAITANEAVRPEDSTKLIEAEKITLKPGDFVHGITAEKITFPESICGLL